MYDKQPGFDKVGQFMVYGKAMIICYISLIHDSELRPVHNMMLHNVRQC